MSKAFQIRLLLLFSLGSCLGASADTKAKPESAQSAASAQYAGTDTCATCHEDVYKKQFQSTPHFQTVKKGHGCESCHGAGAEHVSGGGDKSKIFRFSEASRAESNQRCLSCHGDKPEHRHASTSVHAGSDVGCVDCHSVHKARQSEHLLAQKQPELCYGCHQEKRAEFARPFHHRVNEGLVQCNDCHNVHGTVGLRQVRETANGDAACLKCHVDKQGPFVYEHLPVKTEGCTGCHSAHGSTNARFLKVSNVNLLCLQCHSVPGAGPIGPAHNQSQKYQACTMCHPAIHGSNANVALMR